MKNLKQLALLHQQLLTSSPPHTQMSETLQTMFKTKYRNYLNRECYTSAHVLLNLSNELREIDKCEACGAFYLFFATSLINSIIQEHDS